MSGSQYDLICVGGGLGGAALAAVMARRGARVLVVEREKKFADRVRGEALAPWGVGELRALGLHDLVHDSCGHELRWFDLYYMGTPVNRRDVVATTPQAAPWLAFYHPAMQEKMIEAAAAAGAEVRRGAHVRGVEPGRPPVVEVEGDAGSERHQARLVVGADGRGSPVRRWCNFAVRRDPPRHLFAGVLFEGIDSPEDSSVLFFDSPNGRISLLFPQGKGRVRAYVGHHRAGNPPSEGKQSVERFIADATAAGAPREWYTRAAAVGPLAMFDASDNWVEHPYADGVALVGDAAATSDPTWGQGMSLTLRDVRTLSEKLAANDDWDAAAHAYASEHDRYAATVRTADDWYARLFMEMGEAAEARRTAALPRIAEDPMRMVDVPNSGPDVPVDETARRRFFGED